MTALRREVRKIVRAIERVIASVVFFIFLSNIAYPSEEAIIAVVKHQNPPPCNTVLKGFKIHLNEQRLYKEIFPKCTDFGFRLVSRKINLEKR